MEVVDTSASLRIPRLMDMVTALSRAREPAEVLQTFSSYWIELQGPSPYISLSTRGLRPGEYRITRAMMIDQLAGPISADVWSTAHRLAVHTGGLLGRIVTDGVPVLMHELYLRGDPVLGDRLAAYGTLMAIPLFDQGQPLNWAIDFAEAPDAFSLRELEDELLQSNLVGGTVRHVRTAQELRQANEWIRGEVQRIADLQSALLPARLPDIPGVSMAVNYQTFDHAGGDMYFFHAIGADPTDPGKQGDGRVGIMIGDVAGHGPAAAVVMAMIESMIGGYQPMGRSAAELFGYLNRHLCAKRIEQTFVTAWSGVYDPAKRTIEFAVAGHPAPLLRKCGGAGESVIRELCGDNSGLPLGILPDENYQTHTTTLEPGDTVLLYTDGITETRAPDGGFFGTGGIHEALAHCSGDAQCTVDTIMDRVRRHAAGGRPQDDQTLLAMHIES